MYQARILPPDDWPRLAGTELEQVWPLLDPTGAIVVVVEDAAGMIIGCWSLIPYLHAEGVWVHPAHRQRAAVAKRLIHATVNAARATGATSVMTTALTPAVAQLLTHHLGAIRLPGEMYAFGVGDD
jgi:hypothetical protein